MTIDRTRERTTNQNDLVTRDRIILQHKDLQISHQSRKPTGMEGKCMRYGKPEHQLEQKCAAKNAKCKECHKIGHFYKVCQSKKRGKRANFVQAPPKDENNTHINENGVRQPNPPVVNIL